MSETNNDSARFLKTFKRLVMQIQEEQGANLSAEDQMTKKEITSCLEKELDITLTPEERAKL